MALNESDSLKAPGPYGFNAGSLKNLWPFIKDQMVYFFNQFYDSGFIPKGAKSSFIVLIPKVQNPEQVNDYGPPVSLINASFKALWKF